MPKFQNFRPNSKFCFHRVFLICLESITTNCQTSMSKNVGEDRFWSAKKGQIEWYFYSHYLRGDFWWSSFQVLVRNLGKSRDDFLIKATAGEFLCCFVFANLFLVFQQFYNYSFNTGIFIGRDTFIDTHVPMLIHFVFRFSTLLLSVKLTIHPFGHRQNWLKLDGCNTEKDKQGESLDVFSASLLY